MSVPTAERLLQLLEYVMDDVRHHRPVQGGVAAVHDLADEVAAVARHLEPHRAKRFDALQRELHAGLGALAPAPGGETAAAAPALADLRLGGPAEGGAASARTSDAAATVTLDGPPASAVRAPTDGTAEGPHPTHAPAPAHAPTPADVAPPADASAPIDAPAPPPVAAPVSEAERTERAVLARLADRVFGGEIERFAETTAAAWRAERDRLTARIMYATLRNLERWAASDAFAEDVNLRSFEVVEPIPEPIDPLVTVHHEETLVGVVRGVAHAILDLCDRDPPPNVDRTGSLTYVRNLAHAVIHDPYAGKRAAEEPPGPDAKGLRDAIRDLSRRNLPEWEKRTRREELQAHLREREAWERARAQELRNELPHRRERIDAFFEHLAALLPASVGGRGPEPTLEGGVLFAVDPALRRDAPTNGEHDLTLRIADPVRTTFAGRTLVVTHAGGERTAYLDEVAIPLDRDRVSDVGGAEVATFPLNDYLHVAVRTRGGSLPARVAEAAAILHVLAAPDAPALERALAHLAPGTSGDRDDRLSAAVRHGAALAEDAAAGGDLREGWRQVLARVTALEGVAPDAAWTEAFLDRVVLATRAGEGDLDAAVAYLAEGDEATPPVAAPFTGEPVDVTVDGRTFTVRRYDVRGEGRHVAMLPGRVVAAFRDVLVAPLFGGAFTCVVGDGQVVASFRRDANVAP